MGVDYYDAFKLRKNFSGTARCGHVFRTDEFGFRFSGTRRRSDDDPSILVGGDSKIFSYSLPWEEGFGAKLEGLVDAPVYLQAYPGSSPALFNHEMWDLGVFDCLEPKPEVVIYDYDRQDGFGDRDFKQQRANPPALFSLKRIKLLLGGYAWNRAQAFVRPYGQKWNDPWPWEGKASAGKRKPKSKQVTSRASLSDEKAKALPEKGEEKLKPKKEGWKHGRSNSIDRAELERMKKECDQREVRLVILYLPRLVELVARDSKMRDELEALCLELDIEFFDAFEPIDASLVSKEKSLSDWFKDPDEGIHCSAKAFDWWSVEVHDKVLGAKR